MFNNNFKFRAWDNKNKQWLGSYKELGGFSLTGETILLGEWNNIFTKFLFETDNYKQEDLIITQFTGQTDKNNKEIYAGDIYREVIEYDEGDETEYYVCYWIKEWCRFAWLNTVGELDEYIDNGIENLDEDTTTFGVFECDKDKLTICGNIFEHPEKLKL
jgi:uncharacterized phage protein (TIGR01671 family)